MKTKFIFNGIVSLTLLCTLGSCTQHADEPICFLCDESVIISKTAFDQAPDDPLTILDLSLDGDCLRITFGASGCDGESWEVQLIDSGDVGESYPPRRWLRLSLDNPELCEAYLTRELSFDIQSLQVGEGSVYLHVEGYEEPLLYDF